jgi:DNA adenine methylase
MTALQVATAEEITLSSARPFLKWVGGKTGLLSELRYFMLKEFGDYYEPFLGGGALFFNLASKGVIHATKSAHLSDANAELINTYRQVKSAPLDVISVLKEYDYDEELYYSTRAIVPDNLVERAARTIFLNKTGFNGLYRVNSKGQFNVPFGRYTNPTICDSKNLLACSLALLRCATLNSSDFENALVPANKGDFVYLDPPYVPLSKTSSFTRYEKGDFGLPEQQRLADVFRWHAKRGVLLMLSNSDTPIVRELYADFDIQVVQAARAVNSKGDKRGKVNEVVVRSWVRT